MRARRAFGTIAMVCVLAFTALAGGKGEIQGYFSDAAHKVKATADPVEKRQILTGSIENMSTVLGIVQSLPLISKDDMAGLNNLKATLREKQDELAGNKGYVRVPDEKLDAFSDYIVQDMEQADQVITISVVTLLLIIILIVLIAR
jgi:hypothetical protein